MSLDPSEVEQRCGRWFATVETHATIGSTNDRAKLLAERTTPTPVLVVAGRQTAGRGRGANRWWAPDGALTFSLLLDTDKIGVRLDRRGLLSIATAVAIIEAAEAVAAVSAQYKWPNDVYADGRKLAGVLIESAGPAALVVGVGVNVSGDFAAAPAEVRSRAVALSALTEHAPGRIDFLEAFVDRFFALTSHVADRPPAFLLTARAACALAGRSVTVRDGERRTSGRCAGVDDDGALIVETDGGAERLHAGSIEAVS